MDLCWKCLINFMSNQIICKVVVGTSLLQTISEQTIGRKLSIEETKICLSELHDFVDFDSILNSLQNIIKLIEKENI